VSRTIPVPAPRLPIAVLHLDESCLGNGRDGANPGGAGGLIEVRTSSGIQRRDFYISAPDTTNNKMALCGAIAALQLLGGKGKRLRALVVSDSEYLVKGVREWAPGWKARGWTRKGGTIENLELWQLLVESTRGHDAQWAWVRGHRGHPKNEYANDLAVKAAREQITSQGAVESGFSAWFEAKQAKKQFVEYDPDTAFAALEGRLKGGEEFAIALDEKGIED
jgi:ribonuclease HI